MPDAPAILYHFTCEYHVPSILRERHLRLSTSNFDLEDFGKYPVVWLTSSPTPENHGLLFNPGPDDLNKTHIRITIKAQPYMKPWDRWSRQKGMDEETKQVLIATAHAEETYQTWYISEQIIPFRSIQCIENLVTGEVIYQSKKQ